MWQFILIYLRVSFTSWVPVHLHVEHFFHNYNGFGITLICLSMNSIFHYTHVRRFSGHTNIQTLKSEDTVWWPIARLLPLLLQHRRISRLCLFYKRSHKNLFTNVALLATPSYFSSRIDHRHKGSTASFCKKKFWVILFQNIISAEPHSPSYLRKSLERNLSYLWRAQTYVCIF